MKKRNIFKYIISAALVLSFSACDDWLGNKPKGEMIPETFEDYQMLMNSIYLYRSLDVYPSYITDDIQLVAKGTTPEFSEFEYAGKSENLKNLYSFQHGQIFTPGNSDGIWEGCYNNIYVYNAVINNVLSSTGGSDIERKRLWAEALVGRAFEYLNLVNLYGNHYLESSAASDYGVPLVLSEVISESKLNRASVADVYKQIKEDLSQAVPCLSTTVQHSFNPSQAVGYAFLSRMYLYMGKYKEALDNAVLSLKQNGELLDYKKYKAIQGQWGRLVLADDESVEFPDEHDNVENIYTRLLNNTISDLFKGVAASEDLLETYSRDLPSEGEDMRMSLFFSKDRFNPFNPPMVGWEEFPGYTIYAPYIEMNIGFSTPEVYLIAAECEARVGSKDKALEYLNTLRDMRIKNNIHFETPTTLSQEEVLKKVIDERRREFAFNGPTRLIDLKRLNREAWFAKTITHSAGDEGTWTLPPNDGRYIMPVPETVLSFNPDMPQYER